MTLELYDDAALYNEQYAHYRDDLPFYRRMFEDYGGPVLELGAGTGRVTLALAAAGAQVVAVDASAAMLERARASVSAAGRDAQVTCALADMRTLELGRRFPLVLAPFNTLMHLTTVADQDQGLSAARNHLEAGGAFAFDLYVPHFGPQGVLRREAEWQEVGGAQAELFLIQRHDASHQLLENHYYLDRVDADGRLHRQVRRLVQRYYHRFEIERALLMAGFSRVQWFGDFDRRPFDDASRTLVGVAWG